jgi:hypothetical protein
LAPMTEDWRGPSNRGPLPAADADEAHSGELSDFLREPRIGQVLDLGQRHRGRGQPEGEDRRIGRIDLAVHGRVRKVGRQERQRRVDRRLHLLLGHVETEAQRELQCDHRAAARAGRGHLVQPGHLAEKPLERRRDRRRHHVGARPRIEREDLDGRVVHLGKGGDREQAVGEGAPQQQRGHEQGRRDRPQDEGARQVHGPFRGAMAAPSRSRSAPSTTTCSPTCSPCSIDTSSPSVTPTVTCRTPTVRSGRST